MSIIGISSILVQYSELQDATILRYQCESDKGSRYTKTNTNHVDFFKILRLPIFHERVCSYVVLVLLITCGYVILIDGIHYFLSARIATGLLYVLLTRCVSRKVKLIRYWEVCRDI